MAVEQYANNAATTLSGGIDDTVGTLTVASAAGFPASGPFRILVGTELMIVTAVSGADFTVTRGVEGTAATAHSNGDAVTHILTAGSLRALESDAVRSVAYASRPAAGNEGRLFLPSDGMGLERDTGSLWQPWGPLFPFTPPVLADFAWINQGASATATQEKGGIYLTDNAFSGVVQKRILKKAAPSRPYTIDTAWLVAAYPVDGLDFGVGWRQSSDGKLHLFRMRQFVHGTTYQSAAWEPCSSKYTDHQTFSADYVQRLGMAPTGGPLFLRITEDDTNRRCWLSADGQHWLLYHTIGRTDFLTADEVCFFIGLSASQPIGATLLHWKQS
jgi:hypothetical protein